MAAIDFLNPAPLLYNFEHEPTSSELRERYQVNYTSPALCAEQLRTGKADLGLIPIGALPYIPGLAAVPGCVIASLGLVRSIQLVLRPGMALTEIRTLAADTASRSSISYVRVLLRAFYKTDPEIMSMPADLAKMLGVADAALLIGDPALLALEERAQYGTFSECTWIDLAGLWHSMTGLPWVAAVWAVRCAALTKDTVSPQQLCEHLRASRDMGITHIGEITAEWLSRIAVPAETIRAYLTGNIHYHLDEQCLLAIERFYELAASTGILPAYRLPLLL